MKWICANLDFEYELMLGQRLNKGPVGRIVERWDHILRLMPECKEAQPTLGSLESDVMVWGVTPAMVKAFPNAKWPDTEVVKRVNSKLFSHELEASAGKGLEGACLVSTVAEVEDVLRHQSHVLVKHPLGVAGRERVEVRDALTSKQVAWLTKKLESTAMICEPFVEITQEYSLQFDINEAPEFIGWSELVTDALGQHRGNRQTSGPLPADILETAWSAAQSVANEGYFGPLGIDAFVGTCGHKNVVRPVSEINARVTFGRLALGLFRYVGFPNHVTWWHPSERRKGTHGRPLPDFCDPGNKSQTVILTEASDL